MTELFMTFIISKWAYLMAFGGIFLNMTACYLLIDLILSERGKS